jgi:hypothetical protein
MQLNGGPKDARGRELKEGDEIILGTQLPVQWRILQLTPILDPKAPAGALIMHLVATSNLPIQGGMKYSNMIRVQTVEEAGPMPFAMLPPDGGDEH